MLISSTFYLRELILNNYTRNFNLKKVETFSKESLVNNILKNELSILAILENVEENKQDDKAITKKNEDKESIIDDGITFAIEEVRNDYEVPTSYDVELFDSGKVRVGNTTIVNYSKLNLNLEELSKPSEIKILEGDNFLLFHTHSTESYTVPDNKTIVNYRTSDKEYNVVAIGRTLLEELESCGFKCEHDETLHDAISYNGSYSASLATVKEHLKNKSYDFIIDLHRDALASNSSFRPTAEINGETSAKLMFVIGTDSSGLEHDEWMENLKLALMIQNRANEMYPGLFRDLNLSSSRYNQHVSNGAFILEVGATGNTLEEAKISMKYLSNVMESFK